MANLTAASIAVTARCNLSCSHCGDRAVVAGNGTKQPEPCRKDLRTVFRQLAQCGARTVLISGGEPLLRSDLSAIIDDAGSSGLSCGILTNGTLLTSHCMRELRATGAVSFIRLSIEVPDAPLHARFHDTSQALRTLEKIAAAGLVAGVNMTLMPDTLRHMHRLAEKCRLSGAAFFRAVPVLPVGRSSARMLPVTFFGQCIAALLTLHTLYAASPDTTPPSKKNLLLATDSFACSCPGGSSSIAIAADGSVHLCPMISLEGKTVSCFEQPFESCIAYLQQRKRRLQRQITSSGENACSRCNQVDDCKGGCIAEWYARGRTHGQPNCYKNALRSLLRQCPENPTMMNTLVTLADKIDFTRIVGGGAACVRALPLWTVRFT
jgi:radical SAM protein with 4Fe4S-binding SPASM domain